MSLRRILERELVSCPPSASLKQCAQQMEEENVGAVVVVDDERPIGIVTDRDLAVRCLCEGVDPNTQVSAIMTEDIEVVGMEEGIFDVIQLMQSCGVRRVPVVDEDGKAVGLVSFGDIFQLLGEEMAMLGSSLTREGSKFQDQAA